jgi:threonine/homoserine/homoserine lactone efflux protein
MSHDLFIAVVLFALVSSITPGPNNTMILASGVNFGLRRSLRHLAGICLGFGFMLVVVGLGLHAVLDAYPLILQTLRYVGAAYLLWLAFKLATAAPPTAQGTAKVKPMGFWAAVTFQWVNPKAWIVAMTVMTTYVLPNQPQTAQVLLLTLVFMLVNIPCVSAWAVFGSAMRALLQDPLRLRIFNITMALGLVASLYPMLFH